MRTPPRLSELLFGDLLGLTTGNVLAAAALAAAVLVALAASYRNLAVTGFDRGSARALQVSAPRTDLVLLVLLAMATVAAVQGLGNLLLQSIGNRDYPLMSGAFLLITASIVVAKLISCAGGVHAMSNAIGVVSLAHAATASFQRDFTLLDHLAPTGKTLPNPGIPQASGTTDFDREVQKQDDRTQNSICKGC